MYHIQTGGAKVASWAMMASVLSPFPQRNTAVPTQTIGTLSVFVNKDFWQAVRTRTWFWRVQACRTRTRSGIENSRNGRTLPSRPAQTYLLRFGESNVWKVGWAHDAAKRCADINTHILDELLVRVLKVPFWKVHAKRDWANAARAHQMEQDVLQVLAARGLTTQHERAECDINTIMKIWNSAASTKLL
ncbi:MAG: hypothetical protein OD918_04590 [Gammaproteobacteria bacterium]